MFIKSITIKNFRKFSSEHRIEFSSDITVIKANNEQGKSTLVEAILAVFFDDPKSRSAKVESYRTWGAKELPKITVELENLPEGNFVLVKDFEKKESILKNLESGEEIGDIKKIQEKILEMIGIKSREIMEGTAVIRQDEVGKIELKSAIEDLLTSGEKGVKISEIIKSLDGAIKEIEKSGEKSPGKIKDLQDKIVDANERLEKLLNQNKKVNKLNELKDKLARDYQESVDNFESKDSLHKDNLEIYKIEDELRGWNIRFEELEQKINSLKEVKSAIESISKKMEKYSHFLKMDIFSFENEVRLKISRKQDYESDIENIKSRKNNGISEKSQVKRKLAVFLLIFSLISGLAGVFAFFNFSGLTGVILFLLAVVIFIFSRVLAKKSILDYDTELLEVEKKLKNISVELGKLLEQSGMKTLEGLFSEIGEFKSLKKYFDDLNMKLEVFGGDKEFGKLEVERKELLKKIGIAEEKIKDLKPKKIPPEEFSRLEKEIKSLREKIIKFKTESDRIEGQLSELNMKPEEIDDLKEIIAEFSGDLEKWRNRLKIFEKLKESLIASQANVYRDVKDNLQNSMGSILSLITSGKYQKVSLDENFNPKVFSGERGEEIAPQDYLSGGAIDQSFLAARFSFLKLISGSNRPFVILDDPFHSFDETRREETRKIIQDFSVDFQIIILTCHNEYDKWGLSKNL